MTPSEAIDHALGILTEYTDEYPTGRAVLMEIINSRQRAYFSMANETNREYFGEAVDVDVEEGCVDLGSIRDTDLSEIERIDRIEVAATTAEDIAVGDEVYMIQAHDWRNRAQPGVTVRSNLIEQCGTDLDGITELKLWYSRYPKRINPVGVAAGEADEEDLEIGEPWDWLLVWEIVEAMVRRAEDMDSEAKEKKLAEIMATKSEMEGSFLAHVAGFTFGRQDRFA